ncbi:hypothetical protein BIW11_05197 [Tropilaelaps mercedesae]|uniref:Uncharacterized protein n=1 Tax=Tropilaelaps mercedesae TaxID=418985 RepID=A0A1V9Y3D6_9ACAR|nr:hypothetical protein BIW11_05197 [Tropilaelaps mercedesae]
MSETLPSRTSMRNYCLPSAGGERAWKSCVLCISRPCSVAQLFAPLLGRPVIISPSFQRSVPIFSPIMKPSKATVRDVLCLLNSFGMGGQQQAGGECQIDCQGCCYGHELLHNKQCNATQQLNEGLRMQSVAKSACKVNAAEYMKPSARQRSKTPLYQAQPKVWPATTVLPSECQHPTNIIRHGKTLPIPFKLADSDITGGPSWGRRPRTAGETQHGSTEAEHVGMGWPVSMFPILQAVPHTLRSFVGGFCIRVGPTVRLAYQRPSGCRADGLLCRFLLCLLLMQGY